MTQFRKKPVVIEAVRWDPADWDIIDAFAAEYAWRVWVEDGDDDLRIQTLEGVMRASPGDWVIRGVKGELYPCKPDIFEATYEAVASADSQGPDA